MRRVSPLSGPGGQEGGLQVESNDNKLSMQTLDVLTNLSCYFEACFILMSKVRALFSLTMSSLVLL